MSGGGFRGRGPAPRGRRGMAGGVGGPHNQRPNFNQQRRDGPGPPRNYWNDRSPPPWRQMNGMPRPQRPQFPVYESHHYRGQPQFGPGPGHRGRGNNQRMLGDRGPRGGMIMQHPPNFGGMRMIRPRAPDPPPRPPDPPTRFPPLGSEEERQQKIAETADKLKQKLSTLTVNSGSDINFWEDDFEVAGFSKTAEEDDAIANKGIPELRHEPPELNLTVNDLKDIGRVDPDSSINSYERAERSAYPEEDGLTMGDCGGTSELFDSISSSEDFVNEKSAARYCGEIETEVPTNVRKESTTQNQQIGRDFDQVDFAHLDHSQSRCRDASPPKKAMEDTTRYQNEKESKQQKKAQTQLRRKSRSVATEQPDQLKKVREKLREVIENEQRGDGGKRFEAERNIGPQTDTRTGGFQPDVGQRLQPEIGSDFHQGPRPALQRFQSPSRFPPPSFRPEKDPQSNFRPEFQPPRFDQPNFNMGPRFQRPQMIHSEFGNRPPRPRIVSGERDIRMGFEPCGPPPVFNAGPFYNDMQPKFMMPGGQNGQQPPLGFFPTGPMPGFVGQETEQPPFATGIVSSTPVSDYSQIGYNQMSHMHVTQGPGYVPVVNGNYNPVMPVITNTAPVILPQFPQPVAVPSTPASKSPVEPRVVINPMPIVIEALDIQPPPPPPPPPEEKLESCQRSEEKLPEAAKEGQQPSQNTTSSMNEELEDMQEALKFAKQFMNMNTDAEEKEEREEESEKKKKTQEESVKCDTPRVVESLLTISQVQTPAPREPVISEKQENKESRTKKVEQVREKIRPEIVANEHASSEILILEDTSVMNELPRPKVAFNVTSNIKKITQVEEWQSQQIESTVSSSQSRRLNLRGKLSSESSSSPVAVRDQSKGSKKNCEPRSSPMDDRRNVKDREQRDNQKTRRRYREEGRHGERRSSSRNSSRNSSRSPITASTDGMRDSSPNQLILTKSAHQSSSKETTNDRVDTSSLKIRASSSKTPGNSLLVSTVDANWKDKVINQFLKMSKNDICNMVNSSGLRKFDIAMKRLVKERKYSLSQERRSSADDAVKGYDMSREEFMSQLSAMLDPSATVDVKNLPAKFIQHLSEVLKLDVESHLNDGAESTMENDDPLDGLDTAEVNRENENEGNSLHDNQQEVPSFEQFLDSDVNPGPDYSTDDTFALSNKSELYLNPETHVITTDIGHMLIDANDSGSNPANDDSLPNMAALDDIFSAGIARAKMGQKSANRIIEESSLDKTDTDLSSQGGFLRARNLRTMQSSPPHALLNDIFSLRPDDNVPVLLKDTIQPNVESGAEGWNRKKRQNPDLFRNLTKEEWEARCAEKDVASSSKASSPRGTVSPRALSMKSNKSTRNQSPPTPVRGTSTRSSSATQGRQTDSNDSEDSSSSSWSSDSSDSEDLLHGTPNMSKLLRSIKERDKRTKNKSLNETIRDEVHTEMEREKCKDRERHRERKVKKREKSKRKKERRGKKKKRKHKKRDFEEPDELKQELIVPKVEVSSMDVIIKEEPDFEEKETTASNKFIGSEKDHSAMKKLSRSVPEGQTHVQQQTPIHKRLDGGLNNQKTPSCQKSVLSCPMTHKSTSEVKANKASTPTVPNVKVIPSPDVDAVKKALTPTVNVVKLTRIPAINTVKKVTQPTVKLTPLPAVATVKRALPSANNVAKVTPPPAVETAKKAPPPTVNVVKLTRSSDNVKQAPPPAVNATKVIPSCDVGTVKEATPSAVGNVKEVSPPAVGTVKEASPSAVGIAKDAGLPVVADNAREAPKVASALEKLRKNTESWPSLPEIPLVNVRLVDIKHTVNQLKKSGAKKIDIQAYKARKLQGDTEKHEKAKEVEPRSLLSADDTPSRPKSSGEMVCDVKNTEKVDGLKDQKIRTSHDGTEKNSTNIVQSELKESQTANTQGPLRRRILRRGNYCAEKLPGEETKKKKNAGAIEQQKNQQTTEVQQVADQKDKVIDEKEARDRLQAPSSNEERCKETKVSEGQLRTRSSQKNSCDSTKPRDAIQSKLAQQKNNVIVKSSDASNAQVTDKVSTKKINEKSDARLHKDQKDLRETKQVGKRLVRGRPKTSNDQRNPVIILEKIVTEKKIEENIKHVETSENLAKRTGVPTTGKISEKLVVPEMVEGKSANPAPDKQSASVEPRASSEQRSPVIILEKMTTEQKKEDIEHLETTNNLAKDAEAPAASERSEQLRVPEVVAGESGSPTPEKQLENVESRASSEQRSSVFILEKITTEEKEEEKIEHLEITENLVKDAKAPVITDVTESLAAQQVVSPEIAEPTPAEQLVGVEPRVDSGRQSPVLILDEIETEQNQVEDIRHNETTENLEKEVEAPAVNEEAKLLEVPKVVEEGGSTETTPENMDTVMIVADSSLPQVETEGEKTIVCEGQVMTEVETQSADDPKNDLQAEEPCESIEEDSNSKDDSVIQNVATSTDIVEQETAKSSESNATDEIEIITDTTDNVIDSPETQEELLSQEAVKIMLVSNQLNADEIDPNESRDSDVRTVVDDLIQEVVSRLEILSDEGESEAIIATSSIIEIAAELSELSEYGALDLKSPEPPESPLKGFSEDSINSSLLGKRKLTQSVLEISDDFISSKRCKDIDEIMLSMIRESGNCTDVVVSPDCEELDDSTLKINEDVELGTTIEEENQNMSEAATARDNDDVCPRPRTPSGDTLSLGSSIDLDNSEFIVLSEILSDDNFPRDENEFDKTEPEAQEPGGRISCSEEASGNTEEELVEAQENTEVVTKSLEEKEELEAIFWDLAESSHPAIVKDLSPSIELEITLSPQICNTQEVDNKCNETPSVEKIFESSKPVEDAATETDMNEILECDLNSKIIHGTILESAELVEDVTTENDTNKVLNCDLNSKIIHGTILESVEPVEDVTKEKDTDEVLNCDLNSKIIHGTILESYEPVEDVTTEKDMDEVLNCDLNSKIIHGTILESYEPVEDVTTEKDMDEVLNCDLNSKIIHSTILESSKLVEDLATEKDAHTVLNCESNLKITHSTVLESSTPVEDVVTEKDAHTVLNCDSNLKIIHSTILESAKSEEDVAMEKDTHEIPNCDSNSKIIQSTILESSRPVENVVMEEDTSEVPNCDSNTKSIQSTILESSKPVENVVMEEDTSEVPNCDSNTKIIQSTILESSKPVKNVAIEKDTSEVPNCGLNSKIMQSTILESNKPVKNVSMEKDTQEVPNCESNSEVIQSTILESSEPVENVATEKDPHEVPNCDSNSKIIQNTILELSKPVEDVATEKEAHKLLNCDSNSKTVHSTECITGNDSITPESGGDKITKIDKHISSGDNTSSHKHVHGVKRRHGTKHKKGKKLEVIGEKKIRDILKDEELVSIVKKVQTKESVMARMVEIDLEIHKLMSEKMKLYEMLKSGDLPVEQNSATAKGFAEPLLDNVSTSHREFDSHTRRKESSRTPDRQESTSKARTESPQPRSEAGKKECSRNSRERESSSKTRSVSPHAKSTKSVVTFAAMDDTGHHDDNATIKVLKKKKKKKKRNQEKHERLTRHSGGTTIENESKSSRVRKESPEKQVDPKSVITKGKSDKKSNSSHSSKHHEVENLNLALRCEERESKSVEFSKSTEQNPAAEVQPAAGQKSRRSQHSRESRQKADRAAGLKDDQSKKKEQLHEEVVHETKLRSRTVGEFVKSAAEKQESSQVSEAMVSKGSRKSFSGPAPLAKKSEKRVRRRAIFTKGRKGRLKKSPKPREYSPNVLSASEDEIPLNLLYVKISPKKHKNPSNTKLQETKSNRVIDHLQETIDAVATGKIDEYQQSGRNKVVEFSKPTEMELDVPKAIHQVLPDASTQREVDPSTAELSGFDKTSVKNNCEVEQGKHHNINEIDAVIGAVGRKLPTSILQSDNNLPAARVLENSVKNSDGLDAIETNLYRGKTAGSKGSVNQFSPLEQSCKDSRAEMASLNVMVNIPNFTEDVSSIMPLDPDLDSNSISRNSGIEKKLDNFDSMLETVSYDTEKEVEVPSSAVTRGKRKRMASTDRGLGGNAPPKKRSAMTKLEMMSCYVSLTDCKKYTNVKNSSVKTGSRRSSRISNAGSDKSAEHTPQQKLNTAAPFSTESAMECDVGMAKSKSPLFLVPTSSAEPTTVAECPEKSDVRHHQPIDDEIDIIEMERHSQCDNDELSVIEIERSAMFEAGSRPVSTPLKLPTNVARRCKSTFFNSSGRSSVVLEKAIQEQQSKLRPRSKSVINVADLRADWDEPSLEVIDDPMEEISAPFDETSDAGPNQDEVQIVSETGNEQTKKEVEEVELPRIQYSVHKGPILEVKVFGDSILAASEDGVIYRYSQTCNGILNTYEGHKAAVTCMYVLGVGGMDIVRDWLFSGSLDGSLRCFDIKTSVQIRSAADVRSPIQCMDQAWGVIYLGTKSGYVSRFNIKSHTFKSDEIKFSEEAVLALKATTEGPRRVLIAASRSQPITIRDALSGLFLRTISGNRSYTVYSLMMESNLVYCGTSSTALPVFDFINGSQVELYNAGPGIVCMRMYKRLLFAGCYDGNIYVFDTKERRLVCSIPGPGNMLLSMDIVKNKMVAGSKDRRLHMWQMPDQVQAILATRT